LGLGSDERSVIHIVTPKRVDVFRDFVFVLIAVVRAKARVRID
jgi:hypothetical protein